MAYWAGDLEPAEVDRIDEHVLGCASCSAESARLVAVVQALREIIPPVVSRSMLEGLRARGHRITEHAWAPGSRQQVLFPRGADLLIHRLVGLDLSRAERVEVFVRVEGGPLLVHVPDVPFDEQEGILIACQRHFASLPPDVAFEVRVIERTGFEQQATYTILHVYE